MGRHRELLQGRDMEVMVHPLGQDRPDPGDGGEQGHRIALATQPIQQRQPPGPNERLDRKRQPLANTGQLIEPAETAVLQDLLYRNLQVPDGLSPATIGAHPEWRGALLVEESGNLVESARDVVIGPQSHRSSPGRRPDWSRGRPPSSHASMSRLKHR